MSDENLPLLLRRPPLLRACAAIAALAMCIVGGLSSVRAQQPLAVRGATIIPMVGERIENGTVVMRDGRITAVGTDVEIPVDAFVIDATGKVVIPGLINLHTSAAMSQANEQNAVVPFLSVMDSIDPITDFFEESRRNGVTTAAVLPGNSTMIGGRGAVVRTAGQYVNDMVLRRDVALKLSLQPASGSSRMSHVARLRRELQKARDEETSEEPKAADAESGSSSEESGTGGEPPAQPEDSQASTTADAGTVRETREALSRLLKGELTAFIYCPASLDVPLAIGLIEEFGLKAVLVLGRDCDEAVPLIAEKKIPAIADSTLVFWRTDPRTREDEKIVMPELLKQHGVPLYLQVDDGASGGSHYHWYQAALAVRHGVSEDEALRAITIEAARLLGVDQFVGSIEPGKDGDLVILTGDPLKVSTWVETTIVGGKVVYERSKDDRLRRLFEPEKDAK